jgi:hypothetical protein
MTGTMAVVEYGWLMVGVWSAAGWPWPGSWAGEKILLGRRHSWANGDGNALPEGSERNISSAPRPNEAVAVSEELESAFGTRSQIRDVVDS